VLHEHATRPDGRTHAMKTTTILDDETAALVRTVKDLLRDLRTRGLDEDTIEALLRRDGPGRLVLDRRGLLRLPDYGDATIYLAPIERALYLLILKYDEGIPADDIWKYYDELCAIYRTQTVYDDPERIEAAVDTLCDDSRAALQTTVSRIKRKIVEKVGTLAAGRYAIVRGRDGAYRIDVPRDLVVRETA